MRDELPMASLLVFLLLAFTAFTSAASFNFKEATIADIQDAFNANLLTSRQLVEHYIAQIRVLNPSLQAVIELNPESLSAAGLADFQRSIGQRYGPLHGIPVLLKDNIGTRDRLKTTAGSFALLGSIVPRDAGVVDRLSRAGAIILGKASMSEWNQFRAIQAPNAWSARGRQGVNPYNTTVGPCGSSSGSAIAVAVNMVTVALGMETVGSILCPAGANSVVGIKPTVGLTSRAGLVPISLRQDTVGPMGRTVADAVTVLDAIVGFDPLDAEATGAAARFIPKGGYQQFLKMDGLKGKRVGILRRSFDHVEGSSEAETFAAHFQTMKKKGAVLIDNLEIANLTTILNPLESGELVALLAEFKISLNSYLKNLKFSPVRSLADIIDFNIKNPVKERMKDFGQMIFLAAENTSGIGAAEEMAIRKLAQLSTDGIEKVMRDKRLDVLVFPLRLAASILAIGGHPGISVPAGYNLENNAPFGICFGGLRGSESKLIEVAYAFEQATRVRKIPPLM